MEEALTSEECSVMQDFMNLINAMRGKGKDYDVGMVVEWWIDNKGERKGKRKRYLGRKKR